MEQIAAFMLIVSCGTSAQDCRAVPVPVVAYQTMSDCDEDLRLQLRLNEALPGRAFGVCTPVDAATFERSATADWSITKDGRLEVRLETAPQVVASR